MIGGPWINSFDISSSFSGHQASYTIDGGGGNDSTLIVEVPAGEIADFESAATPDTYHPAYKALAVFDNEGQFALANGITGVDANARQVPKWTWAILRN